MFLSPALLVRLWHATTLDHPSSPFLAPTGKMLQSYHIKHDRHPSVPCASLFPSHLAPLDVYAVA